MLWTVIKIALIIGLARYITLMASESTFISGEMEELQHELVEEKNGNKKLKNKMRKSGRFLNLIMDFFKNIFGGGGEGGGGGIADLLG